MKFLKRIFGGKADINHEGKPVTCAITGVSQVRSKNMIACPGGQYVALEEIEKLTGIFGARAGAGFSTAISGKCSFCGRSGEMRPPAMRCKTGNLICKECVRLISQLAYEHKTFPSYEYQRRRQLWKQAICYFCGEDKANIKGLGNALICQNCLVSMAQLGTNQLISENVRCDLCMKELNGQEGQMGVAGGWICASCLVAYNRKLSE